MPTKREREYYRMGFMDGMNKGKSPSEAFRSSTIEPKKPNRKSSGYTPEYWDEYYDFPKKPKRKVSSWQKFVKANSNKKKFKYASGKLNLKKMGVAYRKTAVYKRNKKK